MKEALLFFLVLFLLTKYLQKKNPQIVSIKDEVEDIIEEKNISVDEYTFKEPKYPIYQIIKNIQESEKVTLKDVVDRWSLNKKTIDVELKKQVITLLYKIFCSIGISKNNNLHIQDIENMYVIKNKDNNFRLIADFFAYERYNNHVMKFVIDFVSINGDVFVNYIDIDGGSVKNIMNKYDVKWRSQGILSNYNMFDKDIEVYLNNHYKSENILHFFEGKNRPTFNKIIELKNVYYPSDISHIYSPMFCKKYSNKTWNTTSIPDKTGENCLYHTNSAKPKYNVPYDAPGVVTTRVDKNNYDWMFNPDRGNL
jgi:hypothetical protein